MSRFAPVLAFLFVLPCSQVRAQETIRDLANEADATIHAVVVGHGQLDDGTPTTELQIVHVLKSRMPIDTKRRVIYPATIEMPDASKPPELLVFCDVADKGIYAYDGGVVAKATLDYAKKLVALDSKDEVGAVRFFYQFLDHPEENIRGNSCLELGAVRYGAVRRGSTQFDAKKVARLLENAEDKHERGVYATLLGHCGKPEDAPLVRKVLDSGKCEYLDSVLVAYVALDRKQGWDYLKAILKREKKHYYSGSAALWACGCLYDERPDLVSREDLANGVAMLLSHPDMIYCAIDQLRKWKRWEMTERVLALFDTRLVTKFGEKQPPPRANVLHFALGNPDPRAKAFVEQQRHRDAEWVRFQEELRARYDQEEAAAQKEKRRN